MSSAALPSPQAPPPLRSAWRLALPLGLLALLMALLAAACVAIVSAARAYVGGESRWTWAQKRASMALLSYSRTYAEADWRAYELAIAVPLGDRRAREALDQPEVDMAVVAEGFIAGGNAPEDVRGMALLYRWFGHLPPMDEAVVVWREGDVHIDRLRVVAAEMRAEVLAGADDPALGALRGRVQLIEQTLTPLEARFSAVIGAAARTVANALAILLVVSAGALGAAGVALTLRRGRLDREATLALQRSETLFRSLWLTTQDAVLIFTPGDHRIRFANPAAHQMFGHAEGTLVGQPVAVLQPERTRSAYAAAIERYERPGARQLNPQGVEVVGQHADGRELPVEVRFNHFELDGEPLYVGFLRDITLRRQAEQAVRESTERLEQRVVERTRELSEANERLLELDRLKSEFLATMSHELRTPLNSILGFTTVLREGLAGPLLPEQQRQLAFVQGSGEHLLALINDVLDMSRIESGRMELADEVFDAAEVAGEAGAQLRPLAERKGLVLQVQAGGALPLRGDRRRLYQVLLNLAGNAVKFTERGSVTLRLASDGGTLQAQIADTGIGIAAEALPKLFQAFRQIDSGAARAHDGTGLGLHLTQKLVQLMGGSVDVQSEPGRGSVFTVRLPLRRPADDTGGGAATAGTRVIRPARREAAT